MNHLFPSPYHKGSGTSHRSVSQVVLITGDQCLASHGPASRFSAVRRTTHDLSAPLSEADATPQSMPDASPAKWHLAHTSWFFEAMVLEPHLPGYRRFDASFGRLFNSYYETLGDRHPRSARGLITRPSLDEVRAYRAHVDQAVTALLEQGGLESGAKEAVLPLIELGCQHEEQHQELLLTDILNLFAANPLKPAYRTLPLARTPSHAPPPIRYRTVTGGNVEIGHTGPGFAFDCEGPRHRVWLEDFKLADRLITNREWLDFMRDDGYLNPLLWLSQGWASVQKQGWRAPLYWDGHGESWATMTLDGLQELEPDAPVSHISQFEADAYARWAGRRLPTEFEWEHAAASLALCGNFADGHRLAPQPLQAPPIAQDNPDLQQMFGDVWEWTSSAFAPYPRFRPAEGAIGEYNGKFMSGQFVLRGGSCVTPPGHIRTSYRNFFPPEARWQFSGVRLAEDA